jgi:hypothetical protein
MGRTGRASVGLLFLVAVLTSLAFAGGASGASSLCGDKVLSDWADNGRLDGVYPLRCYQAAMSKMPADLRDYTDAGDVIQRALTRAVTSSGGRGLGSEVAAGTTPNVGGESTTALPLPLLVLIGVSVAVLAAGALGHLARRRRVPSD